ncbi:MAG: ribonuclease HII [Bdellovibrionales bacterium]|nr:ribonuclease HII [Bdellovibrionales bacterium]
MKIKKPEALVPDLSSEVALGFFRSGFLIIGVDEVGRGCLAGPVVAGAAALDPVFLLELGFSNLGLRPDFPTETGSDPHPLLQVKDSKLIPEKDREPLMRAISAQGVLAHAVSEASVAEIADLNILHASMLAMERAVGAVEEKLGRKADLVLIDGNRVPKGLQDRGRAIVKGDQKSLSIACASIFAKVHRDALMETLEAKYPGYGLSKHKGYPTPFHKAQLKTLGATPIHREGFNGVN